MTTHVDLPGGRLETLDLAGDARRPPIVLLHEGLGSVGLWRDFPAALNRASGSRAIAFSRYGHGRSAPPARPRGPAFMDEEALEVLPALLAALAIARPVLLGHSDGATIALIHAAQHDVAGLALIAPHVLVERVTLAAVTAAREEFEHGGLRERLSRHHDDPAVTFRGWCDVWLDPAFRDWSIEAALPAITAPALVVQGRDDPYGSLAQVDAIARGSGGPVQTLVVSGGHAPHVEHPQEVLDAIVRFLTTACSTVASRSANVTP
jgi:pimeloyl-ACP methyl ester carboxylesterase